MKEGGGEMKACSLGGDGGKKLSGRRRTELPFLLSFPHSVSRFVEHTVRPN